MAGSRRSAAIISFVQGENPLQREAKDACDCALDARMNWQGAGGPLASRRASIRLTRKRTKPQQGASSRDSRNPNPNAAPAGLQRPGWNR